MNSSSVHFSSCLADIFWTRPLSSSMSVFLPLSRASSLSRMGFKFLRCPRRLSSFPIRLPAGWTFPSCSSLSRTFLTRPDDTTPPSFSAIKRSERPASRSSSATTACLLSKLSTAGSSTAHRCKQLLDFLRRTQTAGNRPGRKCSIWRHLRQHPSRPPPASTRRREPYKEIVLDGDEPALKHRPRKDKTMKKNKTTTIRVKYFTKPLLQEAARHADKW